MSLSQKEQHLPYDSAPACKKVLLISYHFPPDTAVGGLRIANFAKTLPMFGIEPVVLTTWPGSGCADPTDEPLNSTKVIRAKSLPSIADGYVGIKRLIRAVKGSGPNGTGTGQSALMPAGPPAAEGSLKSLKRYILSLLFALPDYQKSWILPAYRRAVNEIRREGVGCILTTCPPYSVHLVGLLAKLSTGVRWVADYRDPWITVGQKRLYPTSPLSIRIESWLERQVIHRADLVTFNVERLMKRYRAHYAQEPKEKFAYIPNSFDPGFFSRFRGLGKFREFTLCYAGSLYLGRTPEPVFEALRRLLDEGAISPENVRVKIASVSTHIGGIPVSEVAASYGLEGIVEVIGALPYNGAVDMIARSHAAMLFAHDQPYQIPGKLYDHMGAGTLTLALTEEGATADIVTASGAGRAFPPADIEGIMGFLKDLYAEYQRGELTPLRDLSEFHSTSTTAGLVQHINRIR